MSQIINFENTSSLNKKKKMSKKLFNSLIEFIIVSGCDKDTGLSNLVNYRETLYFIDWVDLSMVVEFRI